MNLNEHGERIDCEELGGHIFLFREKINLDGAFCTVWSFQNLRVPNLSGYTAVEYYKCAHCSKTKLIFMG